MQRTNASRRVISCSYEHYLSVAEGSRLDRRTLTMQPEREAWNRILADATAPDHIVQLYQDQDFLSRAVCRFGWAALANGEGFILVATRTHWNAWRPRFEAEGVDVEAAQARGQMTVFDAEELLSRFM